MRKLQEVTSEKVLSFPECCEFLGWIYENDDEGFSVTCNCGNSKINYRGFFGVEVVECENCKKRITDLFSPMQSDDSTCVILNPKDFEIEKDTDGNDRYWIATSD